MLCSSIFFSRHTDVPDKYLLKFLNCWSMNASMQKEETEIKIDIRSNIRTFTAEVEGQTPISFSKHYDHVTVPKVNDKESPDQYEQRTWSNRLHVNQNGIVLVPQMCVKSALVETARFLSIKIPGKRNATFTKHFERGLLVQEEVPLLTPTGEPVKASSVGFETFLVPSDGKKGGASRVRKNFPVIFLWKASSKIIVLDDAIPNDIFGRILIECGRFNGWGRFRPQVGGFYGRFIVNKLTVSTI